MSGWIKLEKSLESDPRVLRLGRIIEQRNGAALRGVTVAIGALSRLWMLADSHADSDDILSMSEDELNEWIGIPDFCSIMPACWLETDSSGIVKLPQFQAHNGTQAKAKAQNAARQSKHRDKRSRSSVTPRNGRALPDQDLDQDIDQDQKKTKRGAALPPNFAPTDKHRALAAELGVNLDAELQQFTDHHRAKGSTMKDWDAALRTWLRNAKRFAHAGGKPAKDPRLAINRDFSKVDYWQGVKPDGSF